MTSLFSGWWHENVPKKREPRWDGRRPRDWMTQTRLNDQTRFSENKPTVQAMMDTSLIWSGTITWPLCSRFESFMTNQQQGQWCKPTTNNDYDWDEEYLEDSCARLVQQDPSLPSVESKVHDDNPWDNFFAGDNKQHAICEALHGNQVVQKLMVSTVYMDPYTMGLLTLTRFILTNSSLKEVGFTGAGLITKEKEVLTNSMFLAVCGK